MDQVLRGGRQAKSGVEMALWDIAGKAAGLPVYRLLGGKARSAVPLNWTVGFCEPEQAAAEAARYVEQHGIRSVRLKIGRAGDADARSCAAVRKRLGPNFTIRVDANEYYKSSKEAIQAIRRIEEYDLQLVEQPLAAHDLAGPRRGAHRGRHAHRSGRIDSVAPRCHRCHSGAGRRCV